MLWTTSENVEVAVDVAMIAPTVRGFVPVADMAVPAEAYHPSEPSAPVFTVPLPEIVLHPNWPALHVRAFEPLLHELRFAP